MQKHRGPDFFGRACGESFAVCHNRLSIIDTTARSNQPLEDDQYLLLFNGEIYNYIELALEKLGVRNAVSDVWVLFELLKRFGADAVPALNGMFAFVFFGKQRGEVLCARDRLGIKPLYWSISDSIFFCASELKTQLSILKRMTAWKKKENLSPDFINDSFALGFAESQESPFHGINQLPPGTVLKWGLHSPAADIKEYFDLPSRMKELRKNSSLPSNEHTLCDRLDTLLHQSIRLHLRSDAALGILCSGGVDSSLIAALARKEQSVTTLYHASYKGKSSELPWAQRVADHLKIDLKSIEMDGERFLNLLPLAIWHGDLPMYHPNDLSLFSIAEHAKKDGIKVLLCGEGADELFGGYPRYLTFRNTLRRYRYIRALGRLASFIRRALRISPLPATLSPGELLMYSPAHILYADSGVSDIARRAGIIHNPAMIDRTMALYESLDGTDSHPSLAAFIGMNLYGHLSSLLHRNDRMGMMASIETRVPFLENSIIDFALALDTSYKIRNTTTKYLLKKVAERYLPRSVVHRKKQGFPVPWEAFIDHCNLSLLKNGFLSNHLRIKGDNLISVIKGDKQILFTAISIELWGRIFLFDESPEDIARRITS